MRLPIGKYRSVDISEITDVEYLKWAIDNMDINKFPVGTVYKRILELDPGFVSKKWGSYELWIQT